MEARRRTPFARPNERLALATNATTSKSKVQMLLKSMVLGTWVGPRTFIFGVVLATAVFTQSKKQQFRLNIKRQYNPRALPETFTYGSRRESQHIVALAMRPQLFIYIYICIYIYTCVYLLGGALTTPIIYIYIYICTHARILISLHVYLHIYIYIYIYVYIYICICI